MNEFEKEVDEDVQLARMRKEQLESAHELLDYLESDSMLKLETVESIQKLVIEYFSQVPEELL